MVLTAADRAALKKAVELVAAKQAATVKDVEAELNTLLGHDKQKRALVMASALWLTTTTAFAAAYDDEEAFIKFMNELMPNDDELRSLFRRTQKRRADVSPAQGNVH